jgi:predicted extracellular nuclease
MSISLSACAKARLSAFAFRPVCAAALMMLGSAAQAGVVISQVYGGGGNSGATLKNDFIELFNAGAAPVSLNGWSVQYASASGSSWQVTALGNVTLQPGQYYLVQEAAGTGGTNGLPTPDASGNIAMGSTAGKVALVASTTALSGATPINALDFVGYGGATASEGSPTSAPNNTSAAVRNNAGCTDTNNNSADFTASAPTPRNAATALHACTVVTPPGSTVAPIGQIQGPGHTSPLLGQSVTTTGVVTKLVNNGFFIQSKVPDNDPNTSDGIFVFTSTAPTVSVGDEVRLTALVDEFDVSGAAASNPLAEAHTVTELKTISGLTVISAGNAIVPTVITFPELNEDALEKVEGMLVTINAELTVSQNYFLGRYGQATLSAQGRLVKPTNKFPAGSVDAINLAADNARRRILLDDGSSLQNPNPTPYIGADNTLRAGDTIPSITGVIDYKLATSAANGLADYAIHPTQPLSFTRANPRTAAPVSLGNSNVKVASFNVLNFFTTFTDGTTADGQSGQGCSLGASVAKANCRGADSLAEFIRQRDKIVRAIAAINADVVGLMEIQNNGNTAVQNLVDALNADVGAGTYASVSLPTAISGSGAATGTDAIRVAMIYKPAKLSASGTSLSDIDAINNRPPLAQTFVAPNGEKFTVVVNHFKSKGSCPVSADADYAGNFDSGDGQGCWNARRVLQANELRNFIANVQALKADNDVIAIGDLNAYGKEDPVLNLTGNGLADLLETFVGTSDYSYVFDGESGYIDHALASASLGAQVSGAVHWHINADEPSIIDYNLEFKQPACAACGPDYYSVSPYRASDHDPVVVGLNLVKAISGTTRSETINGTPGDDRIVGDQGADLITGGTGRDVFVYNSLRDGVDTITDFTPGEDRIDLSAITTGLRATYGSGIDLIAGGFIQLVDGTSGLQIRIDTDGAAGAAAVPRHLVTLRGVTAAQFMASRDLIQ